MDFCFCFFFPVHILFTLRCISFWLEANGKHIFAKLFLFKPTCANTHLSFWIVFAAFLLFGLFYSMCVRACHNQWKKKKRYENGDAMFCTVNYILLLLLLYASTWSAYRPIAKFIPFHLISCELFVLFFNHLQRIVIGQYVLMWTIDGIIFTQSFIQPRADLKMKTFRLC